MVTSVSQRVRDQIGLDVGDIILQINNTRIRTAEDVVLAINAAPPRSLIRASFERRGMLYYSDFSIR